MSLLRRLESLGSERVFLSEWARLVVASARRNNHRGLQDESATRFSETALQLARAPVALAWARRNLHRSRLARVAVPRRLSWTGAESSALGSACCPWFRGKIHEEGGGPTSLLQRATWVCIVRRADFLTQMSVHSWTREVPAGFWQHGTSLLAAPVRTG